MGVDPNKIERLVEATWLSMSVAFKGTVAQAAIYLGAMTLGCFGFGAQGVFVALYILLVISLPSIYLLDALGVQMQSGEFAIFRQLPLFIVTNVFLWSSVAFVYGLIRGPRESDD